jgi:DNA polymerase III subunit chi
MQTMSQANLEAIFHVMPKNSSEKSHFHYACVQAAQYYRQNQRVFIYTNDQQDAHDIDELLWAFDADSFVPHNLVGEGPKQGAMVEIGWQPPRGRRPILINLTSTVPHFAGQFSQIIDFVPNDEALKVQARERWTALKQWGITPSSSAVENVQTSSQ